uniref:Uncharacterized protein n=1 Tax=Panagrolaimus sp. ES5 TaxID=591445 RepID=A0AC34GQ35_9BILA
MDDMLKDILAQILHSFTDKQKKFCLNALRKSEISKNLIQKYFKNTVLAANKNNKTLETFVNDGSDSDSDNTTCSNNRRKTIEYSRTLIESPNFKIVECEKRNRIRPKLIIFPFKDDKTKCYEYYWYNKKSVYLCCGCGNQRKQIRAKIIDKSGNKCVKLESKEHVCKIREYNSEKYDCDPLSLILDKTKFKTFEYEKNGIIKKALVIFDSTNKDLFYEYYWRSKIERYECSGCNLKLKQISAKIFEKDGNQFVKICNRKHICELRKFNPKKFDKYEIVEAPNFEVVTYDRRGITREKLIIFPTKNRKQCHEYYWNECMKKFICLGCSNKGKQCFAKIVEKDGRKVVEIASTKHICEIREYDSKNYESKIVKAPDFKIMNRSESGDLTKSILFIFCPTNKNLGYEYSWDHRTLCYICLGCHGHSRRTTATLCKDSKGKDFVNLSKAAHICTLREYDPEKYKPNIIIRKPDFELHEQNICGSIKKKLFIYTSKELKMGYKFAYYEAKNTTPYFYCVKCKNENHTVFAQILMDNEKNEYISVKDKKHICEPIEYSSDEYENRKIVKAPRYQLIQRNFRNRIMERLIVFTDDELKMCYEYTKSKNSYKCNICIYNYKHSVFAKLIKAEDGSMEYIELGPNEHKCKPVKYEPPEALITLKLKHLQKMAQRGNL